jgi:hypothetical protein
MSVETCGRADVEAFRPHPFRPNPQLFAFSAHRGAPRARHSQVIGFRAAQRGPASAEAVLKRMTWNRARPRPKRRWPLLQEVASCVCSLPHFLEVLAGCNPNIVRPVVIERDLFHPPPPFFLAPTISLRSRARPDRTQAGLPRIEMVSAHQTVSGPLGSGKIMEHL